MRGAGVRTGWSHVAALLAVAFLSLATVRSNVMQAGEVAGSAMPACGMAGMAHMGGADDRAPGKAHAACAFCAVAGHLPVCASAPALALPSTLAWVAWRPLAAVGPRGPPGFAPRARGPPIPSLIA